MNVYKGEKKNSNESYFNFNNNNIIVVKMTNNFFLRIKAYKKHNKNFFRSFFERL